MSEQDQLLQLIQDVMKNPKTAIKTKSSAAPRTTTSSIPSKPPTGTNNTAIVGYEEVPKTRFSRSHSDSTSLTAETEMIRRAIKVVLDSTGGAPSKRAVKHMSAPKMTRSDRVFKTTGVGSSRSVTLGIIKAIAAEETGCIVREQMKNAKPITLTESQRNANTTQGNYNPMIVE